MRAAVFGNVGDGGQEMGWVDHMDFPWVNRVEFFLLSCGQGEDVIFDIDSGNFNVMRYMDNRNYRQSPQPQVVANVNLYTIACYTLINC
jgi:hypothetical protein